jgi:hypothetical protein
MSMGEWDDFKREIKIEEKKKKEKEKYNEFILNIPEIYGLIEKTIRKYCDLKEDFYNIISLWVIGTYIHKGFSTYPYLFFNAMKGSGKSRLLALIKNLSYNGKHIVSVSESVLFRTAYNSTFCIDEFESVASKDKGALRELLNAAYKNGMCVERAKKISINKEDKYVTEKFNVYCPIAMANIWGMENVLSDRCISLIIEKSNDQLKTRLIEDFENDTIVCMLKEIISVVNVSTIPKNMYIELWNEYILHKYINNITNTTNTNYTNLFNKIEETKLDGRHLELFFPLFIIANYISEEILDKTIESAVNMVKEKKAEDIIENRDIALIDFISDMEETNEFILVGDLTKKFKEFIKEDDEDAKWINSRTIGRSLKRLNMILEKRRVGKGIEVRINYLKAKEKIGIFKDKKKEEGEILVEKITP